jgi:hypothetical protein
MAGTDDTLLRLDWGIASYSARGLTETLRPDDTSVNLRRTVNGTLVDLSGTQYRKYLLTITCRDLQAPALGGIWPGMAVTVDCVTELVYETHTGGPERNVVAGSQRTADGFTYYRPQLVMRVTGFSLDTDEWGAMVGWTLDMAEV